MRLQHMGVGQFAIFPLPEKAFVHHPSVSYPSKFLKAGRSIDQSFIFFLGTPDIYTPIQSAREGGGAIRFEKGCHSHWAESSTPS